MGGRESGVAVKSAVSVLVKSAVGTVKRSGVMCMVMGKNGGRAVVWAAERAV